MQLVIPQSDILVPLILTELVLEVNYPEDLQPVDWPCRGTEVTARPQQCSAGSVITLVPEVTDCSAWLFGTPGQIIPFTGALCQLQSVELSGVCTVTTLTGHFFLSPRHPN